MQLSSETLVRSTLTTCQTMVTVACSLFVISFLGGVGVCNTRGLDAAIIFATLFLFPLASGVAFWILSNRIRRGNRRAVMTAIGLSVTWVCIFVILDLIAFVQWLTTAFSDNPNPLLCEVSLFAMISLLGIGYWSIARNLVRSLPILHLLADRSARGFQVLPSERDGLPPLAKDTSELGDDWPEIKD